MSSLWRLSRLVFPDQGDQGMRKIFIDDGYATLIERRLGHVIDASGTILEQAIEKFDKMERSSQKMKAPLDNNKNPVNKNEEPVDKTDRPEDKMQAPADNTAEHGLEEKHSWRDLAGTEHIAPEMAIDDVLKGLREILSDLNTIKAILVYHITLQNNTTEIKGMGSLAEDALAVAQQLPLKLEKLKCKEWDILKPEMEKLESRVAAILACVKLRTLPTRIDRELSTRDTGETVLLGKEIIF